MTRMVTIPSDEYDELHRLRVEVRLFREELATLQRELDLERKRLDWMAANHGRVEYFDEKREFLVEYADPNSTEFDYVNGPIVQHDWKAAVDAAIAQAEGDKDEQVS